MSTQVGAIVVDLANHTILALLSTTIDQHIAPGAAITRVDVLPINEGLSGVPINRVGVSYTWADGSSAYARLVLKECSDVERRVLDRLQDSPRHVPYAVSSAAEDAGRRLVCMQDLGERQRPDSLSAIDPALQRREAEALADIHTSNLGAADLEWLPMADRSYYRWAIEDQFFRWAWDKAIANRAFTERFAPYLAAVEDASIHIIDEMVLLSADPRWVTLVHTDINPSNVLILGEHPYIIDWDTARRGPLFLDVPHHLSTPGQAEDYRVALMQRGLRIDRAEFEHFYRIAARYIGLRYIWWTLESWQADPSMDVWVEHYLRMITG